MLPMLREMPLAALLPIRDACPLYYPQKSAEPALTKRFRALLGIEAALGAAVAATAVLAALLCASHWSQPARMQSSRC